MQVAQRGTSSGSITSSGYSSLDRWYVNASGGTYTLSQQTFTAGQTDVPGFPKNYLRFAVSTADNNIGLHQRVEDVETLGGKTATLSFWAKGTNPAGGNFVSYWRQDFGSGGSSAVETQVESNIVLTSSWQKFTITFSVPSISGKTIGTGSSTWVEILRQPNTDAGTSAWTADIAQVQLEVGSVATPFEHRSYGDELDRCERYFQLVDSFVATGYGSGVGIGMALSFRKQMRASPSLSVTGVLYISDTVANDYVQSSVTGSIVSNNRNERGCRMAAANFTGLTNYRMYQARPGLGGEIQLSAEL